MSVLATTTRAEDFAGELRRQIDLRRRRLGPGGGARLRRGFRGRRRRGGAARTRAGPHRRREAGIGVPSGRSEMVLTGFGSGKDGAIAAADGGGVITTTGVSTVLRTGRGTGGIGRARPAPERAAALSERADRRAAPRWSPPSRCRPACCPSAGMRRRRSASRPSSSLGGCTLVGPCAAAMNGGALRYAGQPALERKDARRSSRRRR